MIIGIGDGHQMLDHLPFVARQAQLAIQFIDVMWHWIAARPKQSDCPGDPVLGYVIVSD